MQLPTSLEPWLQSSWSVCQKAFSVALVINEITVAMSFCFHKSQISIKKYLSAPKQAVKSCKGLNTLITSSDSSSCSSLKLAIWGEESDESAALEKLQGGSLDHEIIN